MSIDPDSSTYYGRAAKAGNSKALAFEAALFRSHPEFASGEVSAKVIAPGVALVMVEAADAPAPAEGTDPLLATFLQLIERDMAQHRDRIRALDPSLEHRLDDLLAGVEVDLDEDLGPAASL